MEVTEKRGLEVETFDIEVKRVRGESKKGRDDVDDEFDGDDDRRDQRGEG